METNDSLEQIRARAEGTLNAEELALFEQRLADDEELRALAEAYGTVHRLSASLDATLPESSVTFDDLDEGLVTLEVKQRSGSYTLLRLVSLAAGVVIVAGLALQLLGDHPDSTPSEPVALTTIPLASPPDFEPIALPATLASYHPVAEGKIQWVSEREEADRIAKATGRPLLVFGRYSNCEIADAVETSMCGDLEILSLAEQCVPLLVELDELDATERKDMTADGYPCLQLRDGSDQNVNCLMKKGGNCDIRARLNAGLGACQSRDDSPSWALVRDLAALLERAKVSEESGRLAEAHRFFEELVAGGGNGSLAEAGEHGLVRIALAARDALLAARSLHSTDPAGAVKLLEQSVKRFESTPHVAELALVLESLCRNEEFPTLAWAAQ